MYLDHLFCGMSEAEIMQMLEDERRDNHLDEVRESRPPLHRRETPTEVGERQRHGRHRKGKVHQ